MAETAAAESYNSGLAAEISDKWSSGRGTGNKSSSRRRTFQHTAGYSVGKYRNIPSAPLQDEVQQVDESDQTDGSSVNAEKIASVNKEKKTDSFASTIASGFDANSEFACLY
jgi:hypothetical protein